MSCVNQGVKRFAQHYKQLNTKNLIYFPDHHPTSIANFHACPNLSARRLFTSDAEPEHPSFRKSTEQKTPGAKSGDAIDKEKRQIKGEYKEWTNPPSGKQGIQQNTDSRYEEIPVPDGDGRKYDFQAVAIVGSMGIMLGGGAVACYKGWHKIKQHMCHKSSPSSSSSPLGDSRKKQ